LKYFPALLLGIELLTNSPTVWKVCQLVLMAWLLYIRFSLTSRLQETAWHLTVYV